MSETQAFKRDDLIDCSDRVAEDVSDDHRKLLDWLASSTECQQIQVFDGDPLHIAYYDKGSSVNPATLVKLQKEGMVVMHAGKKHCQKVDDERGWIEAKAVEHYEENDWFGL